MITKHRAVMIIDEVSSDNELVCFYDPNEELDDNSSEEVHQLPRGAWEQMGSPGMVTITVEPGDHLSDVLNPNGTVLEAGPHPVMDTEINIVQGSHHPRIAGLGG